MQNVLFRMSYTPGEIKWAGKPRGTDNEEVFSELGIDDDELASLKDEGVI